MHNLSKEEINAYRTAVEDRAQWFYLLLKAAEEVGADPESIAKSAITRYGVQKGKALGEINDAAEFVEALAKGYGCGAFQMKVVEKSPEKSVLHFSYCPLWESWKKMDLPPAEISRLCRLARHGDLGMISNFPELSLEFCKLLAEGEECCELVITRNS